MNGTSTVLTEAERANDDERADGAGGLRVMMQTMRLSCYRAPPAGEC